MAYELKVNDGGNKKDCLIIALGQAMNPSLSEEGARKQGWLAIQEGLEASDDLEKLRAIYRSAYDQYQNCIENIDELLPLEDQEAPEDIKKVKQQLGQFLSLLLQRADLDKGYELVGLLYDDFFPKNNIISVDKEKLEANTAQLYIAISKMVKAAKTPQFLVQNGGHFSNVVSGGEVESFSKKDFIGLLTGPLGVATSYQPPLSEGLQYFDDIKGVISYSEDQLNEDLGKYAKNQFQRVSKAPQGLDYEGLNYREFELETRSKYQDIESFYMVFEQLPGESQEKFSREIQTVQESQKELDSEMTLRLQAEEVTLFNQQQPKANIQANDRSSLMLFFKQYEEDGYRVKDCDVSSKM